MANELTTIILDAVTGEVTERPMTQQELADYNLFKSEQEALIAEQEAKESARQSALAKLAKLGLTQAEIDAL
jgi:hypothetical protein